MVNSCIYRALKQIEKGRMRFYRLKLVCEKLAEMGFVVSTVEGDIIKGYNLTIKGKIFIWDYEHGSPGNMLTSSLLDVVKRKILLKKSFIHRSPKTAALSGKAIV